MEIDNFTYEPKHMAHSKNIINLEKDFVDDCIKEKQRLLFVSGLGQVSVGSRFLPNLLGINPTYWYDSINYIP